MQNNDSLLLMMMTDLKSQEGVYRPGPFWARYTRRIIDSIRRYGLDNFRENTGISKGFGDCCIYDPIDLLPPNSLKAISLKLLRRIPPIKYLYKEFRKINSGHIEQLNNFTSLFYSSIFEDAFADLLPKGRIPDTLAGKPGLTVTVGNRKIGLSNMRALVWIREYAEKANLANCKTVMEIGGGFGAYVHMLLKCFPSIRKVIYLDIPPMLYIGTEYLRHYYNEAVVDYGKSSTMKMISFKSDDSYEIYCIAPWQISLVDAKLDFFWNSASFQEMPENVVNNYAKHIRRLLHERARAGLYIYKVKPSKRTRTAQQIIDAFSENGLSFSFIKTELAQQIAIGDYLIHE
jgi:putative sugar O-methyltransferase